ncbi:family 43 glycosylhydrolase [Maribacter confluentis]|uniref:Family 43 glycosylhydrolase n=1 Tax=Maribacter confluentis TaxID=1656093 RepID=A0ABT8RSK5_9FLAO|nr:family 43 glycosylhydrolase [Maribacter confluentis]MDO1513840.1 family 43 glycosylhydrolase [Maribacter confluentis]
MFAYFVGNGPGEESIRYAISEDGYNYRALNNNEPIVDNAQISATGGVRDPHVIRSHDGKMFYMVVTDLYVPEMGWKNYAMTLMKSTDLIHWTSSNINIPETFPDTFGEVYRVWAPQTIYDEKEQKYMVYFSMKQGNEPDKIYYTYANEDFTGFESVPKQLYFPPANSNNKACIDGVIIYHNGKYHLFHKAEDGNPGIKLAISNKLTEGYELVSNDRVDLEKDPVEGSGIFKLNDTGEYILMYDLYTKEGYQFTKSKDLKNFEVIDEEISMDFHPRHGSVLPITANELKTLVAAFSSFEKPLFNLGSNDIISQNVAVYQQGKEIRLPVTETTDLNSFDPQFSTFTGSTITPSGPQDFRNGPVEYIMKVEGKGEHSYQVMVSKDHNPAIKGYYADPEVLYSNKTKKYYIYPTSDGFNNWSGTYFKTFSSTNLVDWTDEGIILDLKKDVSWADRNAWAPCIIERKEGDEYKYYYYFTAAQKIGVAVSDDPTGPFIDNGKPLIDAKPEGITNGQEIDPDVFNDPKSGKTYLYWGNMYMAVAELNDDMVSLKNNTLKVITPDQTYREGTEVFYREGTYYFMWSEDDTRSPNYKVRYAISKSPTGPLEIPENNIVIEADKELEILATGHNSVLQVPSNDDWYLVYHRFTHPKGKDMGRAAGFHREVSIDKLTFDNNGHINQVKPTLKGVMPLLD